MIFRLSAIRDQEMNCNAATFLAPAGWRSESRVVWVANPYHPARVSMRCYDPQGPDQYQLYPLFCFIDGLRESMPGTDHIWPEGSFYDGLEVRRFVGEPGEFLRTILIPRLRPELRMVRFASCEELPELANAAVAPYAASGVQARAAKVMLQYELDGRPVDEVFYTIIYWGPGPGRIVFWGAEVSYSCRTGRGEFERKAPIFHAIACSTRVDLKWFNALTQLRQIMQQSLKDRSDAVMRISRYLTQVNNEVSDMIRSSYEQRQQSLDRVNRQFDEYVRGVNSYQSPLETYPVQLPAGYDYAWTRGNGEYILSNDPGYNPNGSMAGDWQPMQRVGG